MEETDAFKTSIKWVVSWWLEVSLGSNGWLDSGIQSLRLKDAGSVCATVSLHNVLERVADAQEQSK